MADFAVYILANRSRTIYVGVTNDLGRRIEEHRAKVVPGFTQTYRLDKLVYYEMTSDVRSAIATRGSRSRAGVAKRSSR